MKHLWVWCSLFNPKSWKSCINIIFFIVTSNLFFVQILFQAPLASGPGDKEGICTVCYRISTDLCKRWSYFGRNMCCFVGDERQVFQPTGYRMCCFHFHFLANMLLLVSHFHFLTTYLRLVLLHNLLSNTLPFIDQPSYHTFTSQNLRCWWPVCQACQESPAHVSECRILAACTQVSLAILKTTRMTLG